jgi:hypothetical protein
MTAAVPREVPPTVSLRLNPEHRRIVWLLVQEQAEKLQQIGSLLTPPSPQDVIKGLILREADRLAHKPATPAPQATADTEPPPPPEGEPG